MKRFSYYWGAVAVVKCIRAVVFTFHPGRDGNKATLTSCTGWVRHMARLYENRTYTFVLNARLAKGDAEVVLLDKNKQPLLKLTPQTPTHTITLDAAENNYYLRWEFKRASGSCELRW